MSTAGESAFVHYVYNGQTKLRCGYTTGTCAALAAAGAARLLLTGCAGAAVTLTTPKGVAVTASLAEAAVLEEGTAACCAVAKDAGDDSDVTDGMLVCATVRRRAEGGISIDGGEGVGRVTKPGLDQPIGAAAINRVPRAMIEEQVRAVCAALGYSGGMDVVISIPGGAEAAARTFNPKLGIEGGVSILGTSGIVEPMSESAIADTIALELRQLSAAGTRDVILTPGNYGLDFLRSHALTQRDIPVVKCANFIGAALDGAVVAGFARVLLVGHIGKLVKLAGGVMNTHSRYADCRMELLCAHAAVCGGDAVLCRALLEAATTDAALALLQSAGLQKAVIRSLLRAIDGHVRRRVGVGVAAGAVLFSNQFGPLGQSEGAREVLAAWQ